MLAIDHRFAATPDNGFDAVGDGFEIFFIRDAKCDLDLKIPCLGNEANRVCVGVKDLRQPRIV